MTRLGKGREVFGGSEEKGEEARVKVKSQRSEKWRGVEFIDGETAPVQGSPLSNLVLVSTQRTMDLLGRPKSCVLDEPNHTQCWEKVLGGQCPHAFALAKKCVNPNLDTKALAGSPCIQNLAKIAKAPMQGR